MLSEVETTGGLTLISCIKPTLNAHTKKIRLAIGQKITLFLSNQYWNIIHAQYQDHGGIGLWGTI